MLKLDKRDIKILQILSREGRISKTRLAEQINLSPAPCWERLQRLEKAGVIRGYHAEIALHQVASHVTLFVVIELEQHQAQAFRQFETGIELYDEIQGCWALGGGYDYLLNIVCRDIDRYQRLIDQLLDSRLGIGRYFTYIVTKTIKTPAPGQLLATLLQD
ncbi:MAG: Lrp/AsnC family transcriptional regulator [Thiolinea sp.]